MKAGIIIRNITKLFLTTHIHTTNTALKSNFNIMDIISFSSKSCSRWELMVMVNMNIVLKDM